MFPPQGSIVLVVGHNSRHHIPIQGRKEEGTFKDEKVFTFLFRKDATPRNPFPTDWPVLCHVASVSGRAYRCVKIKLCWQGRMAST